VFSCVSVRVAPALRLMLEYCFTTTPPVLSSVVVPLATVKAPSLPSPNAKTPSEPVTAVIVFSSAVAGGEGIKLALIGT